MKILFIPAYKKPENFSMEEITKLPEKLHILYTIQYKKLAEKIKKELEKSCRILAFQQILGCSKIKPKASLLLIGSGRFHALQIALSTNKEVLIFDSKICKISKEEIEKFKAVEKGRLIKFLSSREIGLLVSTKPGQNKLEEATKLKNKLKEKFPAKEFYIFVSDTVKLEELENFSCFFINFACPGLEFDSKNIINYEHIKKLIYNY